MDIPDGCLEDIYGIMLHCWATKPGDRPSFKELEESLKAVSASGRMAQLQEALAFIQLLSTLSPDEHRVTTQHQHQLRHKRTVHTLYFVNLTAVGFLHL